MHEKDLIKLCESLSTRDDFGDNGGRGSLASGVVLDSVDDVGVTEEVAFEADHDELRLLEILFNYTGEILRVVLVQRRVYFVKYLDGARVLA